MKSLSPYVYAALLALCSAAVLGLTLFSQSRDFRTTVDEALGTSIDYDRAFIRMVDRLEQELATRASFGYEGGKDPMTGLVRQVVTRRPVAAKPAAVAVVKKPAADTIEQDPFRLTAIIFDNEEKEYTAVVREHERSFSVEVGDRVGSRLIRSIGEEALVMESDSLVYKYFVTGTMKVQKKQGKPER